MYYTLFVYEAGQWSPQFGDFSRSVVREELAYYRDGGTPRKCLAIIPTLDSLQSSIDKAGAALNAVIAA